MPVVPEIQALLDQLAAAPLDLATVQPDEMRALYGALAAFDGPRPEVGAVEDRTVPGPAGVIPVRVYRPEGAARPPVLVWFHGGGWVIGDIETADVTCRKLCQRAGVAVVSVGYRLAPEHPCPAASDDAWAAATWVAAHGDELGVDGARLAVGGDSAGGNLAALVAVRARDEGAPAVAHQLLVYPATDLRLGHPSVEENGQGYFLTEDTMRWFRAHYLGDDLRHGDPSSPEVSPLLVDDLSGVAPAQVLTAEYDPLRDEGDAYAARLADAGVPVEHVPHAGLVHGFFAMGGLAPVADEAVAAAAERLRRALHG